MNKITLEDVKREKCYDEVRSFMKKKQLKYYKETYMHLSLDDIKKRKLYDVVRVLFEEFKEVKGNNYGFSNSGHKIKKRKVANDDFTTPRELAKLHVDMVYKLTKENMNYVWYDPFKGSGNYYDQFPMHNKKYYTEIKEGLDFFKFNKKVDVICSNPMYSQVWDILIKCIELKPTYISFLISGHNFTPKRIELLNNNGYGLIHLHICKVRGWYGMSNIVVFKREKKNTKRITYDREVWKQEK